MKKLTFIALAAFASTALAGEFHTYTTLVCSDCHTMHASRTHSYGTDSLNANDTVVFGAGDTGGHEALLLGADVNKTCLTCHNGARGPDVFGLNAGLFSPNSRSAGALNSTAGHRPGGGYMPYMGHSLGSTAMPPATSPPTGAPPTGTRARTCSHPGFPLPHGPRPQEPSRVTCATAAPTPPYTSPDCVTSCPAGS